MVCGEHKPQTDFYKLAPTKRAKKDILGIGRLSRCRHCEISKYLHTSQHDQNRCNRR